jgi:hypothetical protein
MKRGIATLLLLLLLAGSAGLLWAQESSPPTGETGQGRIGAAGAGTIAEKPENTGTIILLVAIPETMVILGFVIAIVLVFTL